MSGPDYLSDADAEAMDRARDPMEWARIDDAAEAYPIAAEIMKATRLAAIRRAWSARPETARAQDERAIIHARYVGNGIDGARTAKLFEAVIARGRHLTEQAG